MNSNALSIGLAIKNMNVYEIKSIKLAKIALLNLTKPSAMSIHVS